MKFQKILFVSLVGLTFSLTSWSQQTKINYVYLDKLGTDVRLKNLTNPQRKILEAHGIGDSETPQPPTGAVNKIVRIPGQKDPFVLNVWCNADMNGGETCDLVKGVNLNVPGKTVGLPKNEEVPLSFGEQSGSSSRSKFGLNEKQELVSIIYAGNYIKTFKGKRTCTNLGIVLSVDPAKPAIAYKEIKIPLGNECSVVPNKNGKPDPDDALFETLFTKLASR